MKIKKLILTSLIIIMCASALIMPVYGASNNKTTIEKISNPEAGPGEADGLMPGGDREASYAWCMAVRGDYIYIGTNKNIIGNVAQTFIKTLTGQYGVSEDVAWGLVNTITNGEVPRPTTQEGGNIFKCNIHTGDIESIFTADKGVSFRMAIEIDGNVYFASYAAEDIGATDTTEDVKNYIYKVDEEDQITKVFESTGGASMRAACIYDDTLLFGGIDEKSVIASEHEGQGYTKLAIIQKDSEDDTKWTRIADYKDFINYAQDPALTNSAGSPIWDICSYDGYVWAVIPGARGFVMFKGHPAESGETANEYGWVWEEVIGRTNGKNNIGLSESEYGYTGDMQAIISNAGTPFVYKNKLYLFDFDMTITAEVEAMKALMLKTVGQATGQKPVMSNYLKTMYTTLKHPQSLWCYNDNTGVFNKVEGFGKFMPDTCNEYVWRYGIYNDELYITTMDSAVMYTYITTLVGSDFVNLTDEEIDSAIAKIEEYGQMLAIYPEIKETLEKAAEMFEEYKTVKDDNEKFNQFVVKYEDVFIELEELQSMISGLGTTGIENIDTAIAEIKEIFSKIDIAGLKMYAYIVRVVEDDVWGFDMFKTADGVNFEVVTNDGFGDPYNYGGRSLVTTSEGLFVGTANPFYGAQLWRLQNEDAKEEDKDPEKPTNPDDDEDKNNTSNGTNTPGKTDPEEDNTIAQGKLPNAGKFGIVVAFLSIIGMAVISITKYNKYKDI